MPAPALNAADRHQIEFVVGNLHVGVTETEVVRELARRLRKRHARPDAKPLRKLYYRYALKCHAENRHLYATAMGYL